MMLEEIKKYIQVGCVVKIGADRNEYTVTDISNEAVYVEDRACSYGFGSIREIISWPIPHTFTEEHIGHYVQQSFNLKWKKIVSNRQACSSAGTEITVFHANKIAKHSYMPLAPEKLKPLLLKDCPVWSFVKLKSKEGVNTPWNYIISKGPHEIIVSQDGSEGSPDPESEVLELIKNIGEIPEHAIIRTKNSMKYILISEFKDKFGKFSDIAAIITESAKQIRDKGIHVGDLVCDEGKWYRVIKMNFTNKCEVKRLHDGISTFLLDTTIQWIPKVRSMADLNQNWYVKLMHTIYPNLREPKWYRVHQLSDTVKIEDILDISTTKPEKHSDKPEIKVGDWVKHFDFDGWQQVVASTNGISVNDRKGSGDHGFYSNDRIIDHKKTIAISDQEWDNLKPGMWVKIAIQEYVESKLSNIKNQWVSYGPNTYTIAKLKDSCGKWVQINDTTKDKEIKIQNSSGWVWHKDFIVDISETEPLESKVLTTSNACQEVPLGEPLYITYDEASHMSWSQLNDLATRIPCCEIPFSPKEPEYESVYFPDIKVGDEIFDKEQWRMILRITTKDEKEYRAPGESKTSLWTSDYSCCLVDYGSRWQIRRAKNNGLLQSNSENKQEKIMLNTLEDIKKLNEANLKEAAEQVKESRDNDEVKAAKAKLTELLDTESKLKVSKEIIDKQLSEVQEMIKAFGYPPK